MAKTMTTPQTYFTAEEYGERRYRLRQELAQQDLDGCLITSPENIYYLTGLDHFGYFAYHGLIVTRDGEMALIARAMEQVTMDLFLFEARFIGFADGEDPARVTATALRSLHLSQGRLGVEKATLFMPPAITDFLAHELPALCHVDFSGVVDRLRQRRSPQEITYIRQAAAVASAMMQAAIDTAATGVNEREVSAEVMRAMALAGGELPGFGPFIRSTSRLGEEHRTWDDYVLREGDALFVELAGCVRRYHAPMGRLLFVGQPPPETGDMAELCLEAFGDVARALAPGMRARDIYQVWQDRVDRAGLSHYRRHHCGYLVGIGFPPSWVGGNTVVGLRHDSDFEVQAGMTFHLMSWLMGAGRGDYFVSDTVLVTEEGSERLTTVPQTLHIV
jgi:Xaa-Pro dipeptidase